MHYEHAVLSIGDHCEPGSTTKISGWQQQFQFKRIGSNVVAVPWQSMSVKRFVYVAVHVITHACLAMIRILGSADWLCSLSNRIESLIASLERQRPAQLFRPYIAVSPRFTTVYSLSFSLLSLSLPFICLRCSFCS